MTAIFNIVRFVLVAEKKHKSRQYLSDVGILVALSDILKCFEINFLHDFIDTLISLGYGNHDLRSNCSQLVTIEVKSGPTYVKQSIKGQH